MKFLLQYLVNINTTLLGHKPESRYDKGLSKLAVNK